MLASETPPQMYRNKSEVISRQDEQATDLDGATVDLLKIYKPLDVRCLGLAVIERNRQTSWRWGLGPRTTLASRFLLTKSAVPGS